MTAQDKSIDGARRVIPLGNDGDTSLQTVADAEEAVIWSDRPAYIPFTVPYTLVGFIALFFITLLVFMIWHELYRKNIWDRGTLYVVSPFVLLMLSVAGGLVTRAIHRTLSWPKTVYACTISGIVLRKGIWLSDYTFIGYDKIIELTVTTSSFEKLLNRGTVGIYAGRYGNRHGRYGSYSQNVHDRLIAIRNPYEVAKKIRQEVRSARL